MGADERPIGRLYSAGSLGHIHGQVYNVNGANYCECFFWGRISGRNAAALSPGHRRIFHIKCGFISDLASGNEGN